MPVSILSSKTVGLYYTTQRGDSYYSIAESINACQGVTSQSLKASNPSLRDVKFDALLPIKNVIHVPYTRDKDMVFDYTTRAGDTMDSIAISINICAGVTEQQIRDENNRVSLSTGLVLKIPAMG